MLIVCRDVCIELGITSLSNGIDCCTEIHWLDTDFFSLFVFRKQKFMHCMIKLLWSVFVCIFKVSWIGFFIPMSMKCKFAVGYLFTTDVWKRVCVCMCVIKRFQITSATVFLWSSQSLTHMIHVPIRRKLWNRFLQFWF